MVMIARQGRILSIFTLLLLCSTHHFAVNSVITHEDDFSTKITHNRPYISSKITGKPVCVTPYYVPTGIKALHDAEFKGRDVKIGIIDSGIDQGIDAFNGNYNYYRDFVKSNNKSKQLPYCNNFGMHMAGIAVAKTDYFTGVAPEATLGTYRVFNCQGPTSTLLVLQALTAAINDQMKIIVLPEIAVIDENSAKLRQMIIIAGVKDVIMIAAAT
ncbi:peptidase S8/S53 domain-containing protein [Syncephalis fuscata]|nr:peptidase S8/S53 domain-containing protein [Syncephalis fuscata]